jgi:hypothetical protein
MDHMFEIQRLLANLASLALLAGAIIACTRGCNAATLLQLVGVSMVVVNIAMNYLVPMQYNSLTQRIEPHWVLNLGYVLSGGGYFIFGAGYLMERIVRPRIAS